LSDYIFQKKNTFSKNIPKISKKKFPKKISTKISKTIPKKHFQKFKKVKTAVIMDSGSNHHMFEQLYSLAPSFYEKKILTKIPKKNSKQISKNIFQKISKKYSKK
jgi:hypothetical protein